MMNVDGSLKTRSVEPVSLLDEASTKAASSPLEPWLAIGERAIVVPLPTAPMGIRSMSGESSAEESPLVRG